MASNYENYRIFYYVAENQNFTTAANQLYLSQPTVSRAIQSLELDLGCTLFKRSRQGITLTEEGIFLYNHVKKAFSFINYAESHLSNSRKLEHGFLRIGATEVTLQHFLLPYLESFREKHPNIHLNISFLYPDKVSEMLDSGMLDIAILTAPVQKDSQIQQHQLAVFEEILVAGSKYRHLAQHPIEFYKLQDEPFIIMEKGTSAHAYFYEICSDFDVEILPQYEVCSTPLIVSMVERNLGIGFLPRAYFHKSDKIYEIKLKNPLPPRQIYALTSKSFPVNSIRDVFLSHLLG